MGRYYVPPDPNAPADEPGWAKSLGILGRALGIAFPTQAVWSTYLREVFGGEPKTAWERARLVAELPEKTAIQAVPVLGALYSKAREWGEGQLDDTPLSSGLEVAEHRIRQASYGALPGPETGVTTPGSFFREALEKKARGEEPTRAEQAALMVSPIAHLANTFEPGSRPYDITKEIGALGTDVLTDPLSYFGGVSTKTSKAAQSAMIKAGLHKPNTAEAVEAVAKQAAEDLPKAARFAATAGGDVYDFGTTARHQAPRFVSTSEGIEDVGRSGVKYMKPAGPESPVTRAGQYAEVAAAEPIVHQRKMAWQAAEEAAQQQRKAAFHQQILDEAKQAEKPLARPDLADPKVRRATENLQEGFGQTAADETATKLSRAAEAAQRLEGEREAFAASASRLSKAAAEFKPQKVERFVQQMGSQATGTTATAFADVVIERAATALNRLGRSQAAKNITTKGAYLDRATEAVAEGKRALSSFERTLSSQLPEEATRFARARMAAAKRQLSKAERAIAAERRNLKAITKGRMAELRTNARQAKTELTKAEEELARINARYLDIKKQTETLRRAARRPGAPPELIERANKATRTADALSVRRAALENFLKAEKRRASRYARELSRYKQELAKRARKPAVGAAVENTKREFFAQVSQRALRDDLMTAEGLRRTGAMLSKRAAADRELARIAKEGASAFRPTRAAQILRGAAARRGRDYGMALLENVKGARQAPVSSPAEDFYRASAALRQTKQAQEASRAFPQQIPTEGLSNQAKAAAKSVATAQAQAARPLIAEARAEAKQAVGAARKALAGEIRADKEAAKMAAKASRQARQTERKLIREGVSLGPEDIPEHLRDQRLYNTMAQAIMDIGGAKIFTREGLEELIRRGFDPQDYDDWIRSLTKAEVRAVQQEAWKGGIRFLPTGSTLIDGTSLLNARLAILRGGHKIPIIDNVLTLFERLSVKLSPKFGVTTRLIHHPEEFSKFYRAQDLWLDKLLIESAIVDANHIVRPLLTGASAAFHHIDDWLLKNGEEQLAMRKALQLALDDNKAYIAISQTYRLKDPRKAKIFEDTYQILKNAYADGHSHMTEVFPHLGKIDEYTRRIYRRTTSVADKSYYNPGLRNTARIGVSRRTRKAMYELLDIDLASDTLLDDIAKHSGATKGGELVVDAFESYKSWVRDAVQDLQEGRLIQRLSESANAAGRPIITPFGHFNADGTMSPARRLGDVLAELGHTATRPTVPTKLKNAFIAPQAEEVVRYVLGVASSRDPLTTAVYRSLGAWRALWTRWTLFPIPGFSIRNAMSNIQLMALSPTYRVAGIHRIPGDSFAWRFSGPGEEVIKDAAINSGVVAHEFTAPLLGGWTAAVAEGGDVAATEAARAAAVLGKGKARGIGKIPEVGEKFNATIENAHRYALFRRAVLNSMGEGSDAAKVAHFAELSRRNPKMAERIIDAARFEVRTYLFDYDELSSLERALRRTVSPFITWVRKNLALQTELFLRRPVLYAAYQDGMNIVTYGLMSDEARANVSPEYFLIGRVPGPFQPEKISDDLTRALMMAGSVAKMAPGVPQATRETLGKDLSASRTLREYLSGVMAGPYPLIAEQIIGQKIRTGEPISSNRYVQAALPGLPKRSVIVGYDDRGKPIYDFRSALPERWAHALSLVPGGTRVAPLLTETEKRGRIVERVAPLITGVSMPETDTANTRRLAEARRKALAAQELAAAQAKGEMPRGEALTKLRRKQKGKVRTGKYKIKRPRAALKQRKTKLKKTSASRLRIRTRKRTAPRPYKWRAPNKKRAA